MNLATLISIIISSLSLIIVVVIGFISIKASYKMNRLSQESAEFVKRTYALMETDIAIKRCVNCLEILVEARDLFNKAYISKNYPIQNKSMPSFPNSYYPEFYDSLRLTRSLEGHILTLPGNLPARSELTTALSSNWSTTSIEQAIYLLKFSLQCLTRSEPGSLSNGCGTVTCETLFGDFLVTKPTENLRTK